MAKYVESATEPEIVVGALKPKDAREHVFGFFRSIRNLPDDPSAGFRDRIESPDGFVLDDEAQGRLTALKAKPRTRLDSHVVEYARPLRS
jgi:hypothetical protein